MSQVIYHLSFYCEKVRTHYVEVVPDFSKPALTEDGIALAPVADLVGMKLTSFRPRDKAHVIDLDTVGLITPEIENSRSDQLLGRLQQVREEENQSAGAE